MMTRGTRRVVGVVLLLAFVVPAVFALTDTAFLKQFFGEARWLLLAFVVLIAVGLVARLFVKPQAPKPAKPKPRPTHLKLVKTDETIH